MGTNASNTTLEEIIDTIYPREAQVEELYTDLPEIAMAKKMDFAGSKHIVRVKIKGQQGRSANYAKAIDNRTSSEWAEFQFTDFDDYATGGVENKTILTVGSNLSDFKDVVKEEMSSCKDSMKRSTANAVYGEYSGSIGRIKAIDGTDTILTLYSKNDHKYFHPGQKLQVATDPADAGTIRAAVGEVLSVDRVAGTVTLAAAQATWAPDDYVYIEGDFKAKPPGFFQLAPKVVTATLFFGVNRTLAPLELAGSWFSEAKGGNTDEVISAAISAAGDLGQDVNTMFLNRNRFNALAEVLKSKSLYQLGSAKSPDRPQIGIPSVSFVNSDGKVINVVPSTFCPLDKSPLLKIEDLELAYRGKGQGRTFPDYYDLDGSKVRLSRDKVDVTEWQLFAHYVLCMRKPKNLMIVEF